MTIRTACSASLSGLHLACQALRNGDCETALVAGSSLIMDPSMTLDMSQQGVLSPSGSCKTFDAAADGFARGEAINAILIKPLDKAIRDGDPVRAVIRSTAVNSDGKTSHLGSPSTQSQVEMIRKAYQAAGISDFAQTPFFECHGTGTSVGDPLEAAAVGAVFGGNHTYIGSVSTQRGTLSLRSHAHRETGQAQCRTWRRSFWNYEHYQGRAGFGEQHDPTEHQVLNAKSEQ